MAKDSHYTPFDGPATYEIAFQGQLDTHWSEWFGGLVVTRDTQGNTILRGAIPDQAALRGVLLRVFDLGLSLLSVQRTETKSVPD